VLAGVLALWLELEKVAKESPLPVTQEVVPPLAGSPVGPAKNRVFWRILPSACPAKKPKC